MTSIAEDHAHDSHHAHNPRLAHHFDTMHQQHNSAKLGMWLFLTTEILLFSGLFLAYTTYRWLHPDTFRDMSNLLNVWMGTLNTLVLIGSSLTMALAVREAQLGRHKRQIVFLTATLICAGAFMVVKYFEYSEKWHHGLLPGIYFHPHGDHAMVGALDHARNFMSIYFMMTGLHGIHVLLGMIVIAWLIVRAGKGHFTGSYYYPVECVGLYWHIVDMIWIFLFPLLYLVDRTGIHHG